MSSSLAGLLKAMALAIFLVYLVMASQFESFLHPFVIIFTLPLGAIGVVLALVLTHNSVNVVALIGAVMLAGIVVNNAIVLIDAVNQLRREEGLNRHAALVEAGRRRLRPILMTSLTTIFGLLPMALGLGEGAELRAPLAITVIGGLSVATLLTLVVIPVVYSLLDRSPDPAAEAALARLAASGESAEGDGREGELTETLEAIAERLELAHGGAHRRDEREVVTRRDRVGERPSHPAGRPGEAHPDHRDLRASSADRTTPAPPRARAKR